MPALNGTGPQGAGPLTGRRMGNCVNEANSANAGYGRGFGRGFRNRGRGFGFFNKQNPQNISDKNTIENEINLLKNQLSFLEKQLSDTKNDTD